jgi:homocysteine S-methyltransferase
VRLDAPLWSAHALVDAPDIVCDLHRAYLRAGAELITANTFRTHPWTCTHAGLQADDAKRMTQRAVDLARKACSAERSSARVLGSVAPLADCYTPSAAPSAELCEAAHREMIALLVECGVDGVLLETMGTVREATAAARAAADLAPERWMLSMCMRHNGPPGVLLSGEPAGDVISAIAGVIDSAQAIGVNCVVAPSMAAQVRTMREIAGPAVRIIAYANTGRMEASPSGDDRLPDGQASAATWFDTDATDPDRYAAYAQQWLDAGATIIGGCCGTTPATIAAVAERLGSSPARHNPHAQ